MPTVIRNLIVFGDSLSDIGIKWKTKSGRMARTFKQMYVNPTGRFSDCRNWTDFMFEAATGLTMMVPSVKTAIALSSRHTSLSDKSTVTLPHDGSQILYVNYAEGGACGDTPAEKGPFLGTFKDQVDKFQKDFLANGLLGGGGTLFIIWFGANDLYTANRNSAEMNLVAQEIAQTQRTRLQTLVPGAKFIFVDMARPLTSVRYSLRVEKAEKELKAATAAKGVDHTAMEMSAMGDRRPGHLWRAKQALDDAETFGRSKKVRSLRQHIDIIENLERGVLLFNVTLARIARANGDRVAELGSVITEATVRQLVEGNYRIDAGAAKTTASHKSALASEASTSSSNITTIDEVHPSERVYRLIWGEIYEEIKRADCVFGRLSVARAESTLSRLGGPSEQAKANFAEVLAQLGGGT